MLYKCYKIKNNTYIPNFFNIIDNCKVPFENELYNFFF